MDAQFIVNGAITLVLSPKNKMEEELFKQFMKQNNELVEMRSGQVILNKNLNPGTILIGPIQPNETVRDPKVAPESPTDEAES